MDFSRRTNWDRRFNRLAAQAEALEARGRELIDLTSTNPTQCGFDYPPELAAVFGCAEVNTYQPDSKGLSAARRALAERSLLEGVPVGAENIILCSGTSEGYGYLLKLLCDAGDNVLVPRPSYPLLDYLARLESVELKAYPLDFAGEWAIDFAALSEALDERTRAVIAINPGNPTGAFLKPAELDSLAALCAERGCALVADEVFSDYGFGEASDRVRAVLGRKSPALTFALGGLSKKGLPQAKVAWLCAAGPPELRDEAMARLELIADTYLASSPIAQSVLPRLLELAPAIQQQIRARIIGNRQALLARRPRRAVWDLLPAEGGWSAIIRLPAEADEDRICLDLLERGLKVQPGYFFDFPRGKFLVLSLIVPPSAMVRGIEILAAALQADASATAQ